MPRKTQVFFDRDSPLIRLNMDTGIPVYIGGAGALLPAGVVLFVREIQWRVGGQDCEAQNHRVGLKYMFILTSDT